MSFVYVPMFCYIFSYFQNLSFIIRAGCFLQVSRICPNPPEPSNPLKSYSCVVETFEKHTGGERKSSPIIGPQQRDE